MNKGIQFFLKVIGIIAVVFVIALVTLIFLLFVANKPKPTVKQLETVCGVHFPVFDIVEEDEREGNHPSYYYTVRFRQVLDKDVIDQIEYLCKYGEKLEDGVNYYMPWKNDKGKYSFYADAMSGTGPYTMPMNCLSISLNLSRDSDIMTIHYTMVD